MKRLLEIMLCVTVLLSSVIFLSSCSTGKGVSDSQLQNEIENSEFIQNGFTSDFVYDSQYEYISHDITKRQTNVDNKEDIIFCNVLAKNKYFEVSFDVVLEYIYYDEGGWIFEKSNIENKIATAIRVPELTLVQEFLYEEKILQNNGKNIYLDCWYNDNKTQIEKGEFYIQDILFDENNQTSRVNILVNSPVINASGHYLLLCEENTGWYLAENEYNNGTEIQSDILMRIDSCKFDYSKAIGTFSRKEYFEDIVKIESIDVENSQITYRRNNESPITEKFDLMCGGFDNFASEMSSTSILQYNPYQDYWYYIWANQKTYRRK